MKTRNLLTLGAAMVALGFLASCEDETGSSEQIEAFGKFDLPDINAEIYDETDQNCKVIDFDEPSIETGTILSSVYATDGSGPVLVEGTNPTLSGNAAMIFDSSNPTGGDPDLGTPNEDFAGPGIGDGGSAGSPFENSLSLGKVLIVSEDLRQHDPDDSQYGGELVLDFSSYYDTYDNLAINYVDIVDVEAIEVSDLAFAELLDKDGAVIQKILLPAVGDNGYARVHFDYYPFVYKMVVDFQGSGSIDNIAFCVTSEDAGCTYTLGYYKNHQDDWCGVEPEDDFFLSGHNYLTAITQSPRGNAYYILSQQYVAAVNNVCKGAAVPDEVTAALSGAKDLFEEYTPSQIGDLKGNSSLRAEFIDYAGTLDDYNNGEIGPGHCD